MITKGLSTKETAVFLAKPALGKKATEQPAGILAFLLLESARDLSKKCANVQRCLQQHHGNKTRTPSFGNEGWCQGTWEGNEGSHGIMLESEHQKAKKLLLSPKLRLANGMAQPLSPISCRKSLRVRPCSSSLSRPAPGLVCPRPLEQRWPDSSSGKVPGWPLLSTHESVTVSVHTARALLLHSTSLDSWQHLAAPFALLQSCACALRGLRHRKSYWAERLSGVTSARWTSE